MSARAVTLLPGHVRFGCGAFNELGRVAAELGIRHALVVSDPGIMAVGYVDAARQLLAAAGVASTPFHAFSENPDGSMVEAGRLVAAAHAVDGFVGLGGGSSMDCAKAVNFVLTNGGTIADYRGYGRTSRPLLPMVGIPTTAGTGSEAQSYALISDEKTHVKMACGDPGATFAAVILDPELTASQPARVAAAAGYDAIAHAVETWVTRKRTAESDELSREAWTKLSAAYERVLASPHDMNARGDMLLGAYYAGAAIERSMLGAAHACANPLTATYGTVHGVAVALLLRHVVSWNSADAATRARYAELEPRLEQRLTTLASAGQFPAGLAAAGASKDDVGTLAQAAAEQWTGTFNPRPFDAVAAQRIYEMAW